MKKTKKRGPDYRGIALNLYNQKYNKSSYQDGTTILPEQEQNTQQNIQTGPGGYGTMGEFNMMPSMNQPPPTFAPPSSTQVNMPQPFITPPPPQQHGNRINYRKGTKVRPSTFTYQNGDKTKYDPYAHGLSNEDFSKHIKEGTATDVHGNVVNISDIMNEKEWQNMSEEEKINRLKNIRLGAGGPRPSQEQFDMMHPDEKSIMQQQWGGFSIGAGQPSREEMMRMHGTSKTGPGGYGTMGEFNMLTPEQQATWLEWAEKGGIEKFIPPNLSGTPKDSSFVPQTSYAYGGNLETKQRQAKQQMYFGPRAPKIPDNFYTAMYGSKVPGYKPGDVVTGKDAGVNKNIDPSLEGLHPDELTVINREEGEIVERQLPNLDEGDPGNYFVYEGNTHNDVRDGMPNGGNNEMEQIGAFITPKKYSNQMEKIVINRKENQDILKTFV